MDISIRDGILSFKGGSLNWLDEEELDDLFKQARDEQVIEIDISENRLNELPLTLCVSIRSIRTVRKLNLANNWLSTLPGYLTQIDTLEELDLQGNPLISPPPEVVKAGTPAVLAYLKRPMDERELAGVFRAAAEQRSAVIDLSSRGISKLPGEIGLVTATKVLMLNHNKISFVPEEISKLLNLEWLELYSNRLTPFPLGTVHLPKLRVLLLAVNAILRHFQVCIKILVVKC
jgi:leucine-rich repeat protein SHOC2